MPSLLLPFLTAAVFSASPAEVALLCSPAGGQSTQLRFQPLGSLELAPVVAEVAHLPGESVLGSVLPHSKTVLAIATTAPTRDLSFAASLIRLEADAPPRFLADRVVPSTRPLVTSTGRVFVQRGKPGTVPTERGAMRVDSLTIDEISTLDGSARTVHTFTGFIAFLAGEFDGRLIVYRVGVEGADLIALHPDALSVTLLARITPLARDFVVDSKGRALYYTQGNPQRGQWFIERLDFDTLKTGALPARGFDMALLPTLFPKEPLAFSPGTGQGLRAVGTDKTVFPSTGKGYERLRAFAARGNIAIGLNEVPSDFATPFAVDLRTGKSIPFVAPAKNLLDIAGLTEP
jgi:hypothetical protein